MVKGEFLHAASAFILEQFSKKVYSLVVTALDSLTM